MTELKAASIAVALVLTLAVQPAFGQKQTTINKVTKTTTTNNKGQEVTKEKTVDKTKVDGVLVAKSVSVTKTIGGGSGDPLMMGFDGTLFFFDGQPGKYYNLISEPGIYQVSTLLKEANNAVHLQKDTNGTYMQAVGVQEGNAIIEVKTFAHDSSRMMVTVNGKAMGIQNIETLRGEEIIPLKQGGEVKVFFSIFHEADGTIATVLTPHIEARLSLVPPGLDHAGYWQPSYINVNVSLLTPPQAPLQGVIGDTYHLPGPSQDASTADSPKSAPVPTVPSTAFPVYPDMAYELPALFAPPPFTFPAAFTRDTIAMRKKSGAKKPLVALVL